ncbi:MAG: DsbA family oxidoreductase, partial [Egibacteraceae bacterium]
GLDGAEAKEVLAGGDYAEDVRADEADAQTLGISGVPFFVVDRTYGVSGAQSPEVILQVLERAWADDNPLNVVDGGESCADGSCAV